MKNSLQDPVQPFQVLSNVFRIIQCTGELSKLYQKILAKKFDIFVIVYPDNIFIYTKDLGQGHVEVIWWVLDVLRRHRLFANLKKCQFHKNKVCFLGYVVLAQEVKMEDKKIKAVKNWPEPTLVRDIQVFIGFPNFY